MSSFLESTFKVAGKSILITGASSGFGEHFARTYAKAGARRMALLARRTDKLESLATELRRDYPGMVVAPVRCDVSDVADVTRAFDDAERDAQTPAFDVIVNNAGLGPVVAAVDETAASYNQVMDVNVRGCFFVAQEAAKRMMAAKVPDGSIINIGSIYGMRVGYAHSVYSISKAAVTQMTKALSLELLPHGIRVNAINPGFFRTELTQEYYDSPKGDAFLQKHVPLKRLGLLQELDGALLLLSSEASKFMHGSVIVIDGGHVNSSL